MLTQATLLIIGVVLVVAVFSQYSYRRRVQELEQEIWRLQQEKQEEEQIASGFAEFNERMSELKEARKEQVLADLQAKGKIQNDDVEDLLDVSHATATRYLEELEQEGKIVQKGKIGRGTFYTEK